MIDPFAEVGKWLRVLSGLALGAFACLFALPALILPIGQRVGVPPTVSFRDLAAIIGNRFAVKRVNLAQERYERLQQRGAKYTPS